MSKPTGPALASAERRIAVTGLRLERRAEGSAPVIVGHAAVFDSWTVLWESRYWTWREVVRPGAFRDALAERQDVRALINHDANLVLGRSTSGTLELSEDSTGLAVLIHPPDVGYARDLATLLERGDVSGMSFGFRVRPNGERSTITSQGDRELEDRELLSLDLTDVSVVTYPAYDATDVSVRSRAEARDRERARPRHLAAQARARIRLAEALAK